MDKINKLIEINSISEHLTSFPLAPLAEDKKFLVEEGQTPDTFTVAMFADSTNTQFYKKIIISKKDMVHTYNSVNWCILIGIFNPLN